MKGYAVKVDALFSKQSPKSQGKSKGAPKPKSKGSALKKNTRETKGWLGEQVGGAKNLDKWYGPNRSLFLPDGLLDRNEVPSYLNGTLPGDYGYDPLGLGKDIPTVQKYRVNELIHARWAMLAAAGIIIPEGLQANGAQIRGGTYFTTIQEYVEAPLRYFAVPWGIVTNPLPLPVIAVINVVLIGAVEQYRAKGEGPPGYAPGVGKFEGASLRGLDGLYPGGPFDPLGLADDPEVFDELKVKEIKNGRLAMVAILAFAIQSAVTKEGPYLNWAKHVSDPFGYNIVTILEGETERSATL